MPPGQRKAAAGTSAAARSVGITFDPSKEVLVLDYKGLSALPYSSESLFKSFRAFIFPKGKFVHSPRALARYFVLGKYRVSTALTLVTFAETSNREPELLLNFVQSADCQDVMLETVQTPLKISSGVYQKATRISAIDAVTGFMAIDMSTTPWSTDLSAYLKTIEQFRSLKITNATEMLTHISKPLETRITSTLKTRAELALRAETDALAKQDAAIADETNARHSAKLDALVASMIEHNPGAYDALLSSRITNRNGKPYKRACGAYQKNMHEAASLARSNTDAKAAASITQLLDANSKLNHELREALTELAKMKAAGSSAVEVAQLREQAKGHEAYHKAYMEGLEKGIAMATGHATRIPASASSI